MSQSPPEPRMFDSLLESRAKKQSRLSGSVVSTVVHALIVGAIVAVTANAGMTREEPAEPNVVFTPVDIPPPPPPRNVDRVFAPPLAKGRPALFPPVEIPSLIPPVNLELPVTNEQDWLVAGARGGSPDGVANIAAVAAAIAGDRVFTRESVDRVVAMLPGSTAPRYPEMLRAAGIEGEVRAQFVVDTLGRADVATLRILQSDHPQFAESIRSALPRLRFAPAEVRGIRVRQLVQQPFRFGLGRQ